MSGSEYGEHTPVVVRHGPKEPLLHGGHRKVEVPGGHSCVAGSGLMHTSLLPWHVPDDPR